jgi:hypothetical protein
LRALDPEATYRVEDLDTGSVTEASGADLMEPGLMVRMPERPGARALVYRRR